LLDEMMDFGHPQYTEAKILSEFIKTDAYRMEVTQQKKTKTNHQLKIPTGKKKAFTPGW